MESKFIRILVTLGVPGVALGIFFLLLRTFNFQFSQVNATWTAAIAIIFLLLVGAITLFALHRWSPRISQPPSKNSENIPSQEYNSNKLSFDSITEGPAELSTLTVKNIIDEIHNAAPFQRDEIAKNYHGIKVNWEGAFYNVRKSFTKITGDSVRVELKPEPKNWSYSILFEVPLRKYPQLKIAQEGDLIGVSGRIIACSSEGMYVELDVNQIEFH